MAKISATWTKLASTARLQRSSQCLSVLDSCAWIFGGELLPRQPKDSQFDVIKLDAAQEPGSVATLTAPAEASSPRVGSTTVGLKDTLYMFSGRGGLAMAPIEEKGALWRYSPGQPLWKLITDRSNRALPCRPQLPRHGLGWAKHYLHPCRMPQEGTPVRSVVLQCRERHVDRAAGGSTTRTRRHVHCHLRRTLYRMNGFDGTTEQGGAIDVFDLDAHTWSTITFEPDGREGPEPRSVSALVAVNAGGTDTLLTLFGERDPSSLGHAGAGKMLADVWAFDLGREEWTKAEAGGDAPAPRGWFGADVAQDQSGKFAVIVHGGLAEDNSRLGDIWSLQFE